MTYVPLRVHSDFSLGIGASSVSNIIKRAGAIAAEAIALTDFVSMSGCFNFSSYAKKAGIKPIIGCQFVVKRGDVSGDIIVLAINQEGYRAASRLLQAAYKPVRDKRGVYAVPKIPVIDLNASVIEDLSQGLIVLSGKADEGLAFNSLKKDKGETIGIVQNACRGRFYVEICRAAGVRHASEDILLDYAYGSHGTELPIVGTVDSWYATRNDAVAYEMMAFSREARHEVVLIDEEAWQTDGVIKLADSEANPPLHIPDDTTFQEWFADLPEAIQNTQNISIRASFMVEGCAPMLPPFQCPGGVSESDYMAQMAYEGLEKNIALYGLDREVYASRLQFEIDVINRMGFPGYFLIVSDFIKWSKANNVSVGPGRGSGAGSLVAWCLSITDVNPIEYGLLFERFLNPERVSMPDFDIDFEPEKRELVFEYVKNKYGENYVCAISAFSSILAKSSIELVARSTAVTGSAGSGDVSISGFSDVQRIRAFLPDSPSKAKEKLSETIAQNPEFKEMLEKDKKAALMVRLAQTVEGLFIHQTRHAAGIVISGQPLTNMFPVIRDRSTNFMMSGYDMKGTEAVGAVKFDFLGLQNLETIQGCLDLMRQDNIDATIDMSLNDPEVFRLLRTGLTQGVFQFSGGGMIGALQQVRPDKFSEIVAITALYRPGPMKYLRSFANRKLGREVIDYPLAKYSVSEVVPDLDVSEVLERYRSEMTAATQKAFEEKDDIETVHEAAIQEIMPLVNRDGVRVRNNAKWPAVGNKIVNALGETYGYFVYQEQVMLVARDVAGYTYAGADMLRRAMGKKIREEMTKQKAIFVEGCAENGITENDAVALFDDIERFADYGFNKSHAMAYTVVSYQTAWLKTYYPEYFYAALLQKKRTNKIALREIMNEMVRFGIPLELPNINLSGADYTPIRGQLSQYVISGISGIGSMNTVAEQIIEERTLRGPFSTLANFWKRTRGFLNIRHFMALTEAGALDTLDPMYSNKQSACRQRIATLLVWLNQETKTSASQNSLFNDEEYDFPVSFPIKHHINKKQVDDYRLEDIPEWHDRGKKEYEKVGFTPARNFMMSMAPRLANAGCMLSTGLFHIMSFTKAKELNDVKMVILPEHMTDKTNIWGLDKRYQKARAFIGSDGFNEITIFVNIGSPHSVEAAILSAMNSRKPLVLYGNFKKSGWKNNIFFAKAAVDANEYLRKTQPSPDIFVVLDNEVGRRGAIGIASQLQDKVTSNPFGGRITFMTEDGLKESMLLPIIDRPGKIGNQNSSQVWPSEIFIQPGEGMDEVLFDIDDKLISDIMGMKGVLDVIRPVERNLRLSPDQARFADTGTRNAMSATEAYWEMKNVASYGS